MAGRFPPAGEDVGLHQIGRARRRFGPRRGGPGGAEGKTAKKKGSRPHGGTIRSRAHPV